MKVKNTISTYPDEDARLKQPAEIDVESHWNDSNLVNLVFGPPGNPCTVTVAADDLKRAIDNATNHK